MAQIYDFSKALIRCSCLYYIVAPGKTKTPKQLYEYYSLILAEEMGKYEAMGERKQGMARGLAKAAKISGLEHELNKLEDKKHIDPLPQGAKTYLKHLYGELKYGKKTAYKEKGNKYTNKGKIVQSQSIDLISELDDRLYIENGESIANDFIIGTPDCYYGESLLKAEYVPDVKSSWDWDTFSENMCSEPDDIYWWQIQGYLELSGAKEGEVSFCLINIPDQLLTEEIMNLQSKMQKNMNVIDVTVTAEYRLAEANLINNLTFDNIPAKERRLQFPITRSEEAIKKIYDTVPKCRDYLFELQEMHLSGKFTDKEVKLLDEIEEI